MQIYLVGGAVRDALLGLPVHERDYVVVGASPAEMLALGYQPVGKDFPVFLHPQTRAEYALARRERKTGVGYTGFAIDSSAQVSLSDDLLRRDLTINAMAQDAQGRLIDPYGGQADLEARVLRHVSAAFVEDPLRVLRVARFAARFADLGFQVAAETLQLMQQLAASGELATLSCERVWRETEKALHSKQPQVYFEVLAKAEALAPWFIELQQQPQSLSALQRCSALTASTELRMAALLASLEDAGAAMAERLRAPKLIAELAGLAQQWQLATRPQQLEQRSQALLTWMQQADCWRRPERWQQVLLVSQALGMATSSADQLATFWQQLAQLSATEVMSAAHQRGATLQGPAIAQAIEQARLQRLTQLLESADHP